MSMVLRDIPKLMDEPMNGLDKQGIEIVKKLFLSLKERGKTILLASHYAEDMEICDEIIEMDEGRIESHH